MCGPKSPETRSELTNACSFLKEVFRGILRPLNAPGLMALHVLFPVRMLDGLGEQLEKYMDLVAMRQKLVASNIANIDTPGYRTKDIDFQFEFQSAQAGLAPDVIEVKELPVKNDGNDVNLEREARLLSEDDLRFTFAANVMRDNIKGIRSAITDTQG